MEKAQGGNVPATEANATAETPITTPDKSSGDTTVIRSPGSQVRKNLPPAPELAKEIVAALVDDYADIHGLEPDGWQRIDTTTVLAWITEDVTSALKEIAADEVKEQTG